MFKRWKQVFLLAATLTLALLFSAVTATPALADDAVPPPADSAVTNPPPVEETPAVEEPVAAEEPVVTEEPVAAEEPVVTEEPVAAEEPAVTEVVAEVLAQLPEGTELVVTNPEGEALPLVSVEAAEALMEGDPMWCPTGVTPGGAGCTAPQASFSALIPLIFGKTVPGTIWIRDNYVGTSLLEGGAVNLDGSTLGTTANFALTLQGGWTGVGAGINASSPSTFNVPLNIFNWNANVTLNDILVTSVAGVNALTVSTTKDIALNRVEVRDNPNGGAVLDNSSGTGKVTVGKSKFNNNAAGAGLVVFSKGAVTLNDVIANQNSLHGAYIDNRGAATPMAVTINNSVFNGNARNLNASSTDMGLVVYSKGAITISNLTANNNGNSDADIDDGGVWLENTAGTAGVTLTGVNIVSDNEWGLGIFTNGAVTLYNMVNNGNANGSGLYIDNCGWSGTSCANPASAAVSILGKNEFKFNSRGVYIRTNGAITLNNVTATFNQGNGAESGGAFLWNAQSPISAGVTLTGVNVFSNNGMTGLRVDSKGVVTLNNVTASENGFYNSGSDAYLGYGAYIDNTYAATPKAVTLLGTNGFYNNANAGLVVFSKGAIRTNNLSANWNNWNHSADTNPADSTRDITGGAHLDNCLPDSSGHCTTALTSSITLTGINNFNGNGWGSGLYASSLGAISVSSLTANDNGGNGAILDNNWDYWNPLLSAYKLPYSGVTITGYGQASNNGNRGIGIFSTGAILTYNLTAQNNLDDGAFIYNAADAASPRAVTLGGTNLFESNANRGLHIRSYGAVTANNITAQGNGANGAFINNCGWDGSICAAAVFSAVNLTGSNTFNSNGLHGLEVHSKGVITVNNVQANGNSGNGALLDNQETGATGGVNVRNTSAYYPEFSSNQQDGLAVFSNGSILVMDLDAYQNGGYGVFLDNANGGGTGNVNLGTSRARWINALSNNFYSGLEIYTNGVVTLINIQANNNGGDNGVDPVYGYGACVRNDSASAPKGVTLLGRGEFYNNASGGLYVYSKGAILLANIDAGDNGHRAGSGNGAYLNNTAAATPQAVTLTGSNNFNNNKSGGLEVLSNGVIKANNVDSSANNFGVLLDNHNSSAAVGVYITGGVWTSNNALYGMNIQSKGAISIVVSDAWAGGNGGYGWDLDNSFSGAVGGVTLSSPNIDWAFDFWNNGAYGLWVRSLGNIYVAGLDSDSNGGFGTILDNAFPGATGSVTLLAPAVGNNSFYHNGSDGLRVYSNRAITVGGLQANENNGAGAVLNNRYSGAALPQNVTLTGTNNFHMNRASGLEVLSYGAILLNNVTANGNGTNHIPGTGWGVYAVNCDYDAMSGTCSGAALPKGVTLSGVNNFQNNYQDGLFIRSLGAIFLSKTEASNNRIDGAYIENGWGVRHANVTISGYGTFNGNGIRGLVVYTNGTVVIANLDASGNGATGAEIAAVDNNFSAANVTLSGSNSFWGNGGDGLYIVNDGYIYLNNVTSNNNGGRGAYLDNRSTGWWLPLPAVRLNLTGVNTFNGNNGNGLEFRAYGNVNMTKVAADNNGGNGVLGDTTSGNITLSCGSMNGNRGGSGYNLNAAGTLTLSGVNGYYNRDPNVAAGANVVVNRYCPLP
ncbi:MAG: hypothetical protein LDL51_02600 [Chloroflexi bacterium]|nr:hypothetical protein [Chloroflexota bacterium]